MDSFDLTRFWFTLWYILNTKHLTHVLNHNKLWLSTCVKSFVMDSLYLCLLAKEYKIKYTTNMLITLKSIKPTHCCGLLITLTWLYMVGIQILKPKHTLSFSWRNVLLSIVMGCDKWETICLATTTFSLLALDNTADGFVKLHIYQNGIYYVKNGQFSYCCG